MQIPMLNITSLFWVLNYSRIKRFTLCKNGLQRKKKKKRKQAKKTTAPPPPHTLTFLVDKIIPNVNKGMTYYGEKKDICTVQLIFLELFIYSKIALWKQRENKERSIVSRTVSV